MLFILITLVLVLAIAFFHSLQGAFSAILMAVFTILSAAVAVNFYARLSGACMAYLPKGWMEYSDAMCLAVLFFLTLVVLRVVGDNFIKGNIVLPIWADRIAAGIISIPVALLVVGMASLSVQMLPFDGRFLFFHRFDEQGYRRSVFPKADDFAASTLGMLSVNSLSGDNNFAMLHPDWPGELSAQRYAVQQQSRHVVEPGCVKVLDAWRIDEPLVVLDYSMMGQRDRRSLKAGQKESIPAEEGNYYLVVRMELTEKACDPDGYQRFGWGQARLVGFDGYDTRRATPMNFYIKGFRSPENPRDWLYMRIQVPRPDEKTSTYNEIITEYRNFGVISQQPGAGTFDVVFEVPEGFQPWFLEFKRWARTPMPNVGEDNEEPEPAPVVRQEPEEEKTVAREGWHSATQIDYDESGYTPELPFLLTAAANSRSVGNAELSRMEFTRGSVAGWIGRDQPSDLDSRTQGRLGVVRQFYVPSDKVLFRVQATLVGAETQLLGQIFGAVQNISQRYLVDANGNRYFPAGQYVIADKGDGSQVELHYDPDQAEMGGGYGKPFRMGSLNQLQGQEVRVGFLFLVDPGVALDRFEAGGRPFEALDLSRFSPPQ